MNVFRVTERNSDEKIIVSSKNEGSKVQTRPPKLGFSRFYLGFPYRISLPDLRWVTNIPEFFQKLFNNFLL